MVEAEAPDDDRERQRDPRRERDREHGESNAENERVHSQVVVGLVDPAVPRMGDPSKPSLAATGRDSGRFRDLRAGRKSRASELPSLRTQCPRCG